MKKVLKISDGKGNVLPPFSQYFENLSDISEIDIYDSRISVLGRESVVGCENLSSVSLSSIVEIGSGSFKGCGNLKFIKTSFDDKRYVESYYRDWCAPLGCSCFISSDVLWEPIIVKDGLFHFYITPKTCGISNENGTYSVKENTLMKSDATKDISSISFSDDVMWSKIEQNCFYECSNIISICFPNSISSIGNNSFYKCSNLSNVIFPNTISCLGRTAFNNISRGCFIYVDELSVLHEYITILDLKNELKLFDDTYINLSDYNINFFIKGVLPSNHLATVDEVEIVNKEIANVSD